MNYENLTKDGIENVLKNGNVCILALSKNNIPYIVPTYYIYEIKDKNIYIKLKMKNKGKKIEYLKDNSNVCLFFDDRSYGTFDSVIIKGKATLSKDSENEIDVNVKSTEVTGRSY